MQDSDNNPSHRPADATQAVRHPVTAHWSSDLESSDYTSIQQRLRETAERLGDVDKLLQPVAGVLNRPDFPGGSNL